MAGVRKKVQTKRWERGRKEGWRDKGKLLTLRNPSWSKPFLGWRTVVVNFLKGSHVQGVDLKKKVLTTLTKNETNSVMGHLLTR